MEAALSDTRRAPRRPAAKRPFTASATSESAPSRPFSKPLAITPGRRHGTRRGAPASPRIRLLARGRNRRGARQRLHACSTLLSPYSSSTIHRHPSPRDGDACFKLQNSRLEILYEEYSPYGSSAYRSSRSGVDVSARRYRYVGLERDSETGLDSMGARYYAAWLGRWTSADPLGVGADGPGIYNYTRGSPVVLKDPGGMEVPKKPVINDIDREVGGFISGTFDLGLGGAAGAVIGKVLPDERQQKLATGAGKQLGNRGEGLKKLVEAGHPLSGMDVLDRLGVVGSAIVGGAGAGFGLGWSLVENSKGTANAENDEERGFFGTGALLDLADAIAAIAGVARGGGGPKTLAEHLDDPLGVGKWADDLDFGKDPDFGLKPKFEIPEPTKPPALPAGPGKTLIKNKFEPHEAAFAEEILEHRGGTIVGPLKKSQPGIDGTIDGRPMSLKETQGGLGAVLRHASQAEAKARKAGVSDVEVFIKAPNVSTQSLLDFGNSGPLGQIPSQGTVSAINVLTANGWVRFVARM